MRAVDDFRQKYTWMLMCDIVCVCCELLYFLYLMCSSLFLPSLSHCTTYFLFPNPHFDSFRKWLNHGMNFQSECYFKHPSLKHQKKSNSWYHHWTSHHTPATVQQEPPFGHDLSGFYWHNGKVKAPYWYAQ